MKGGLKVNNLEIKQAIKNSGLKQYEIAKLLNISEFTFVRHLRYELPQEEKEKILKVIKENKKED